MAKRKSGTARGAAGSEPKVTPSALPASAGDSVESVLQETRKFPPDRAFSAGAHVKSMAEYEAMYRRSIDDPERFWGDAASELFWFRKWDRVLEWDRPDARWFVGGKTNLCYNCVDRQVKNGLGDQVAIVWEGEPTAAPALEPTQAMSGAHGHPHEVRRLTYHELYTATQRFGNVLKSLGVKKGDIVTLYMPMVPELAIAMLSCARIGAAHSIIFGGFSASAIRDRVEDAGSRIIVTADGGWRRGKAVNLKATVDEALTLTDKVRDVVVLRRTGQEVSMKDGRDHGWHEIDRAVNGDPSDSAAFPGCPCEEMDSEDLLFILYTSGTTGKPKGIMHTTGGYMVYTYLTSKYTFDLHAPARPATPSPALTPTPGPRAPTPDLYWCTADIGWVTGHSYIVYGILPNRVPTLMYEGAPNHPGPDRFWDIIRRHRVTHFYTAPTAIRAFMKWGDEHPRKHDLSSLRVLGSVGEPINPEAWMWYHRTIGGGRCPIVDTWWQTETGGHMITPLPGATTLVPGSCTRPFFGIDAAIVSKDGEEMPPNAGGFLVVRKPWPSMLRGIWGDRDRFLKTYWSEIPGCYFAGDGARRDPDGNFWVMGRVDDVINVSGHRLGTMEVESALVSHPAVAEAAVVGIPHEIKGTGIAAFVTLRAGVTPTDPLKEELRAHVAKEIGAIARPDQVRFTDALPKTRSGKIMRRLLRELAAPGGTGEIKGDTTTLEDFSVLAKLRGTEEA